MSNEVIQMAPRESAGLTAGDTHRFSAVEIRQRVNLVQEVMQNIMLRDTHFGTIPGTPKPTLFKPGAEVLCVTFRIAQEYRIEDLSIAGVARYRVTCLGRHQMTGIALGEGVGECSSGEEKYKWRGAACKAELDATPENLRRKKYYKNGSSVDQIRTEPADLANTILKMACKRAMIAMTLNVTAASDIFTQDIEDLPEELRPQEHGHAPANTQPATNPELAAKWVAKANAAESQEALTAVWQQGVVEIRAAKDTPSYEVFKSAVGDRGAALKAAEPAIDAGAAASQSDDEVDFEDVPE